MKLQAEYDAEEKARKTCPNCWFSRMTDGAGECHLNPPTAVFTEEDGRPSQISLRPHVFSTDTCQYFSDMARSAWK